MAHFALLALLFAGATPRLTHAGEPQDPVAAPPAAQVVTVDIGPVDQMSLFGPTLVLAAATTDVTFIIDSPGGSVNAGLAFVDAMTEAQRRGVKIRCIVPRAGMAASMGAFILQHCDQRVMHRQATVLFHSVSVDAAPGGTVDDVERFAREMRETNHYLAIRIAGRLNMPLAEFERRIHGDWWLGYEEALAVGAVDAVLEDR